MQPFIIFGLPRSRTAWLSHWLSYIRDGKRIRAVGHDAFSRCGSVEDCLELFSREVDPLDGTCETGAAFAYRKIREVLPEARLLVVQRNPMESLRSVVHAGIIPDPADWQRRVQDLYAITGDGVRTVSYEDLNLESCCKWIWNYTLGLTWDQEWWDRWRQINVQIKMGERLEELERNSEAVAKLKEEVAS